MADDRDEPSATTARVGVVMVAYKSGPVIDEALRAITAEPAVPVVVVDNSPADHNEVSDIVRRHAGVTLLRHPENLGFCAGNNTGFAALPDTQYVVFLNPDAVVEPGFAKSGADLLDSHPEAGALNPKLVRLDAATLRPTGDIDSAGIFLSWYGRPYNRGKGETDRGQYDSPEVVTALCGSAFFARTSALAEVARDGEIFDEAFFTHKEDVDLSLRLTRRGWKMLYCPSLVVGHVRGTTEMLATRQTRRTIRRRSLRNEWRLLRKREMPIRIAVPMTGYLLLKSVAVGVMTLR